MASRFAAIYCIPILPLRGMKPDAMDPQASTATTKGTRHDQDTGSLHRPRKTDEHPRTERLHRSMASVRAASPPAHGPPGHFRALVLWRHRAHSHAIGIAQLRTPTRTVHPA